MGRVHLWSRNENDFSPRYPSTAQALAKLRRPFRVALALFARTKLVPCAVGVLRQVVKLTRQHVIGVRRPAGWLQRGNSWEVRGLAPDAALALQMHCCAHHAVRGNSSNACWYLQPG
jgi:hypothetical protein